MKADKGDRLIVKGCHVGDSDHVGEILEVRGSEGTPPYVVRWQNGHTATVFPGSDARVQTSRKHS